MRHVKPSYVLYCLLVISKPSFNVPFFKVIFSFESMDALTIFLPNNINRVPKGFLLGFYKEDRLLNGKFIYILDTQVSEIFDNSKKRLLDIVGSYSSIGSDKPQIPSKCDVQGPWITVSYNFSEIVVESCCIKNKLYPLSKCIVVSYDSNSLTKSEFLLSQNLTNAFNSEEKDDHFRIIAKSLQILENIRTDCCFKTLKGAIKYLVVIFTLVYNILNSASFVLKYSNLAVHLKNYSHSILCIGHIYLEKKYINHKIGNYIMSIAFDVLAGFLVYYTINKWTNVNEMFDSLSNSTEEIIKSIGHLVNWLMGSPAGLKLNQPLSNMLGTLVLYYLEIWWSFLCLTRPIFEIAFLVLIKLGFLGLTFQLAVCADIFAILSFHVYCIYVYAARLYEIQAKGLYSLSRLVLGRKRNPEPGKIDSCPYSTEELLIGTISFAVLLFLLPTTLVYYVVFTLMRIGVIIIRGLFTQTIYFIQTLPLYTTFLWIFFPSYTSTTVKLTPSPYTSSTFHQNSLVAKLTTSSWLETIKHCVPNDARPPGPLAIGQTMWRIIVGKLI